MKSMEDVVKLIESLEGYEGYIQYLHRPIEKKDLFIDQKIVVEPDSFIYEAHFCNGGESIAIKQINEGWQISRFDISAVKEGDKETFFSIFKNLKIVTAQIWIDEADPFCAGLKRKRLQNVVFAGFEGDIS